MHLTGRRDQQQQKHGIKCFVSECFLDVTIYGNFLNLVSLVTLRDGFISDTEGWFH